jgi:hypothetical protein
MDDLAEIVAADLTIFFKQTECAEKRVNLS